MVTELIRNYTIFPRIHVWRPLDTHFKVAGTKDGITALQMDIKIQGITEQILTEAWERCAKRVWKSEGVNFNN